MAAKPDDKARQIKQMVNFIMQEAHEKCNELKIKTEMDFNSEKSNLILEGKKIIKQEYEDMEKNLQATKRVNESKRIGDKQTKKMKARDDLLVRLRNGVTEKLVAFSKSPQYLVVLKGLIVQGLMKIEESTVEIQCRPDDKAAVTRLLPDALNEFRTIMTNAGHKVNPKVKVSNTPITAKGCSGGLILTALDGRIVLNQTLDERLTIGYQGVMPGVRAMLFPPLSK